MSLLRTKFIYIPKSKIIIIVFVNFIIFSIVKSLNWSPCFYRPQNGVDTFVRKLFQSHINLPIHNILPKLYPNTHFISKTFYKPLWKRRGVLSVRYLSRYQIWARCELLDGEEVLDGWGEEVLIWMKLANFVPFGLVLKLFGPKTLLSSRL